MNENVNISLERYDELKRIEREYLKEKDNKTFYINHFHHREYHLSFNCIPRIITSL